MKKTIPYIVTILITALVTILIIKGPVRCTQQSGHNIQSDTVVYHDTIPYYKPVAQSVKDNGKTQVSVSVRDLKEALNTLPPIRADTHDTAMAIRGDQPDSIIIDIPSKQSIYKSGEYTAYVSGVSSRLDSIFVYPKHEIVTISKPPNHWHIGITGGIGAANKGMSPFIGVGLMYSLFSF